MILAIYEEQEIFLNGVLPITVVEEITMPVHVIVDTTVLMMILDAVSKLLFYIVT